MKLLIFTLFFINTCYARPLHFVSIEHLAEQEIGRIILPYIYKSLGVEVTVTPLPGKRAQYEVLSGNYDGEIMRIASYENIQENIIRIPTSYYKLETMAFVKRGSNIQIRTKEDLLKYSVVKVRGVQHTDDVTLNHRDVTELNSTKQIMIFLEKGRAEVALTNTADGIFTLQELGYSDIVPIAVPLAYQELFHYITTKNAPIATYIDAKIREMRANGQLFKIVRDAEVAVVGSTITKANVDKVSHRRQ